MKKINYISLTLILGMTTQFSYTQNLVPNSSFEIFTTCPTAGSQLSLAIPWQGVTTNSSDYYNACGIGGTNVPNGGGGAFQYAKTGFAFAGIWVLQGNYREYLQVKLDSVLEQDSCYLVEFYCNVGNLSAYGINKMAAGLSSFPISITQSGPGSALLFTPQIISNQFLADTVNWMKVSGYYRANGGEQYITIGNFNSYATTDTLHIGGSLYGDAYYYIDDVTVKKIAGCDTIDTVQEYNNGMVFNLYPNPNDGNMIFEYSLPEKSTGIFMLYDIAGRVINKYKLSEGQNNLLNISESGLRSGVYSYTVIIDDKIKVNNKIVIVK